MDHSKPEGSLMIIGGNEDKTGQCRVLREFVHLAGGRESRIAIITTATEQPRLVGEEYRRLFQELDADLPRVLLIDDRQSANDRQQVLSLETATGIFFTGGDQLRITSILGGSQVDAAVRRSLTMGAVVAGTSAGASVMSETMIVGGHSNDSPKKSSLSMAHGMGFLGEVVIDQHFAQRGRINRLLSAVAQNPHILGIGIDEDTAIVVAPGGKFRVIGSQTVTVIDGKNIVHSNISESTQSEPLAITNVILHILPDGFGFDLKRRHPHIYQEH
ncbi:cyanophycinase [Methylomusa anaerophila]|nr:cyanophycinase [Methylomusa anaerophila]